MCAHAWIFRKKNKRTDSVRLLDSLEYFIRKASLILEKSPKFLSATYV